MFAFLKFLWNTLGVVCMWLLSRIFSSYQVLDSRRAELVARRDAATTYSEWRRWAREVDDHDGYQTWRLDETSRLFACDEVTARIRALTDLRKQFDYAGLLQELSADFHRRMCGVTNPLLYSKYQTGTKAAARLFVSLLQRLIGDLAAPNTPGVTREHKIAALSDLSRAYGHAALILNSSAAFGFYHLGIIKVLYEQDVLPRVVFGRSSGAIAAAFLCCSSTPGEAFDPDRINTAAFTTHERVVAAAAGSSASMNSSSSSKSSSGTQASSSFWRRVNRLFSEGYLMDVSVVLEFARDNLGDVTFEEAYRRTGRVLNIFVQKRVDHGGLNRESGWLLNYLSAPNITVASACVASIAHSGVYRQVPLMQKTPHGTIVECVPASLAWTARSDEFNVDKAIARLRHLFNVNFFIVSEASARHLPFLTFRGSTSIFGKAAQFVSDEFWRFSGFVARHLCRSKLAATIESMGEEPHGDVILFPITSLRETMQCLTNPSRAVLDRARAKGEQVIWPRLEEIRANMLLERAMHDALLELQQQKASSSSGRKNGAAAVFDADATTAAATAMTQQQKQQRLSESQHFSALEHFTF